MARHGTTTVEVKAGCGGGPSAELKLLRALSMVKDDPIDVVATFLLCLPASGEGPDPAEAAVEWACEEFLPLLGRQRLAQFADIEWSSVEGRQRLIRRYLETASRLGLGCRIHADGDGPLEAAALACDLRIAGIDHLEQIAAGELGGMAAIGPGRHAAARSGLSQQRPPGPGAGPPRGRRRGGAGQQFQSFR